MRVPTSKSHQSTVGLRGQNIFNTKKGVIQQRTLFTRYEHGELSPSNGSNPLTETIGQKEGT